MLIPLSWLREYVDLPASVDELCEKLTMLGLEIESVERRGEDVKNVVVGKILSVDRHPDADKIVVCKTDVGTGEPLQICCGAKNMKVGDKVPTAVVGASLPSGMEITKRKMRGVESQGMMCSGKELGLGDDHEGLLILDPSAPIGQDVRALLGLDDVILEIEVTPNRGDWAGLIGIARELAAAYGTRLKWPEASLHEAGPAVNSAVSIAIEAPDLCSRYIGRVITGIRVGPSPDWIVRRLLSAGQRPINNIVDVTNYVLLETGQPLHAFDLKTLGGRKVVVRRARAGERIAALTGADCALTPDMLVIADASRTIAVAGIVGGKETEVGEATGEILLESAYFDPVSVRRSARALNLVTEASQRFQRGADPEMAEFASRRAARLIVEIAGGSVLQGSVDVRPKTIERKRLPMRFTRTKTLLGVDVSSETQERILNSLGFETIERSPQGLTLSIPPWRHDVAWEEDFVEEIARLHGYDKIEPTLPKVRLVERKYAPEQTTYRAAREFLTASGLTEITTWSFMAAADAHRFDPPGQRLEPVPLQNPLSEQHALMRTSLLPAVMRIASSNLRKNRKSIAIFELAPVYFLQNGDYRQRHQLAIALAGTVPGSHWSAPERAFDVYDLKGYVEALAAEFTASDAAFTAAELPSYAKGATASVMLGATAVGVLGEVCRPVAAAYDIDTRIFAAEIDLGGLVAAPPAPAQHTEIPEHPPALRDLAVVVDDAIPAGALSEAARRAGGADLHRVGIFDVYRGKGVPEGKKSVALSLVFQSRDRTLTDDDTTKAIGKIVKALEREFQAQLR
jgi:phenylalanyl-tRNA synthetase beta chain